MELLVEPFMQSSIADKVVRYHVGIAHPDRVRARVRRSLGLRIGTTFKRGSGTKSIVASIALPLLVAQADRREACPETDSETARAGRGDSAEARSDLRVREVEDWCRAPVHFVAKKVG